MLAPPRRPENATTAPLRKMANTASSLKKSGKPEQARRAIEAHEKQKAILQLRDLYALAPELVPDAPEQIAQLRAETIELLKPPTMKSWDRFYSLLDAIAAEQATDPAVEGATS